jgi:hypothetical protein
LITIYLSFKEASSVAKRIATCQARFESSSEILKNLDGTLTGKKARIVCLSTLSWQNTFRFQVRTVTALKTMKKKKVRRAIENAQKTK